ncbi:helix-turn-helix transcriptional regulator [Nocardioides sp. LS1]|uniref:helix-turn-helix domain-containing protein n=1 Tax=Nocardioides sp. LS1 TaxID=1027620 RepID=UPI000FF9C407|nr:helix-turn-helix transcriptional regulator [Nocardioides sp. LS1]GCD91044.1 hypothetical protein NLS1_30500 [Nocardioides sp. LS1]
MPKVSPAADDRTPLAGSRIDIPVRIGWLLRTHRMVAGLSLREMSVELTARGVRLSSSTLSRIETEGHRSPAALDGYADVLGLPDGLLRGTIGLLCRTFRYAPPESREQGEPGRPSLDRFSAACDAVDVPAPTGGAWMRFARAHSYTSGFGLPVRLMEPHLLRINAELGLAVGTAMITRHEALSSLRIGPYGDLLEEVTRDEILVPGHPAVDRLFGPLSDRPTRSLLHWLNDLLRHERVELSRSATYALQSMLLSGDLDAREWATLVPALVEAWSDPDPGRRSALAQLATALPPELQREVRRSCDVDAALPAPPPDWSRSRRNRHYERARELGRAVCARLGHPEEPLLDRLVFESLFEIRGVRMAHALMLLRASAFRDAFAEVLLEELPRARDEDARTAMRRALVSMHQGRPLPEGAGLLESEDDADFVTGVRLIGSGGGVLPDAAVERGLAGDEEARRHTVTALGQANDPRLRALRERAGLSRELRDSAVWWSDRSGRILI